MFVLQLLAILALIYYVHQSYEKGRKYKEPTGEKNDYLENDVNNNTIVTDVVDNNKVNTQIGGQVTPGEMGNRPYDYLDQPESYTSLTKNYREARSNTNLFSINYPDFPTFTSGDNNDEDDTYYRSVLHGIMERSPLSDYFFSGNNIKHLKCMIAKLVKDQANLDISPASQRSSELVTIMRHAYLQHSNNIPGKENIEPQVAELNKKVLLEVVPIVINNAKMNLTYQRDAGGQPLPMERPQSTTIAGTRTNQGFSKVFI